LQVQPEVGSGKEEILKQKSVNFKPGLDPGVRLSECPHEAII
jgi:hypothetical protein